MANKREIQKIIFARHGHRYPFVHEDHELYPHEGLLTGYGLYEMVKIGKKLKNDLKQYIPEAYDPEKVAFHSTKVVRTIQSAQAVALGMYPGQNIPINTFLPQSPTWAKTDDTNFDVPTDTSGQFYQFLEEHNLRWTDENIKMRLESSRLLEVDDPVEHWWVATEVFQYLRYMNALPAGFSDELRDQLTNFLNKDTKLCYAYKDNLIRNAGYQIELLKNLLTRRATDKDSILLHYISSHDGNLSAMLSALDVDFVRHPDFGKHVEITLCENNGDFSVKIKPHDENPEVEMPLNDFKFSDKNKIDDELLLKVY